MRIALIGHGKMGKELEKAAIAKGHEVVLIITEENLQDFEKLSTIKPDVAIDFTTPATVIDHINKCFDAKIPLVVGTTGWYDKLPEVKKQCEAGGHSFIYASNFSIGVNIMFEVNRMLAKMMNSQADYDVSIEEIHHTQKLDSPSGTAITIAGDIIERLDRKKGWIGTESDYNKEHYNNSKDLVIKSARLDNVVGTHIVTYQSAIDKLELKHEASSRAGFVQGALVAAEWIVGKKGFYTMQDLLGKES